jgi:hypothetical protein
MANFTAKQNYALSLIFDLIGESRYNRTLEEYAEIASRLPPLKVLHNQVNEKAAYNAAKWPDSLSTNFKAGDRYPYYETLPKALSIETIRAALTNSGMVQPRKRTRRAG